MQVALGSFHDAAKADTVGEGGGGERYVPPATEPRNSKTATSSSVGCSAEGTTPSQSAVPKTQGDGTASVGVDRVVRGALVGAELVAVGEVVGGDGIVVVVVVLGGELPEVGDWD